MKHTPGPWGCWPGYKGTLITDEKARHIAEMRQGTPDTEANANLIAAAPELLDALKAVLTMRDRGPKPRKLDAALSWRENEEKADAMALAAIAKAEGR